MNKKIIAIITAIALVASLSVVITLVACNENENEGNDETNQVELEGDDTSDDENQTGTNTPSEIGDPGDYSYTERNETVYVSSSAATLRSAKYEPKGSIAKGTQLTRTGISTDELNYWSKVTHNGETYYIASKLLTDVNPAEIDAGFTTVEKTVRLNGNGETGTLYLNVRDIPSMQSSVIGQVTWEMDIKVVAENTTSEWYKIEFKDYGGNTKCGYIVSDAKYYATESTTPTPETNAQEPAGGNGK